jgi:hypothetical protein
MPAQNISASLKGKSPESVYHDCAWWQVEARRCGTDWRSLRLQRQFWLLRLYGAPQSTCDAVLYELRTYGLARLQSPVTRRRLGDMSDAQLKYLIAALIRLQPKYHNISDELILALDGIIR